MSYTCRKCGSENLGLRTNPKNQNATDLFCKDCGAWLKFANKDDVRLYSCESVRHDAVKKSAVKLEALPQYHFDRDDFTKAFEDVFNNRKTTIMDVVGACIDNVYTTNFLLHYQDDDYYIIHLPSGTIINWYKHLGRINTCNKIGFTLSDLKEMLTLLKNELEEV